MNITLDIERLVITGLALKRSERGLFQAALERELHELLRSDGLKGAPERGSGRAAHASQRIRLHGQESPSAIGKQVAHAVYKSLGTAAPQRAHGRNSLTSRSPR